jgi:hypothetical protein
VAASSSYLPFEVPLRVNRGLCRQARRRSLSRGMTSVWGCPLLGMRTRSRRTPASVRAALALHWRRQQRSGPSPQAPALSATRTATRESTLASDRPATIASTGSSALPAWGQLPRSARRRERRDLCSAVLLLGPQLVQRGTAPGPLLSVARMTAHLAVTGATVSAARSCSPISAKPAPPVAAAISSGSLNQDSTSSRPSPENSPGQASRQANRQEPSAAPVRRPLVQSRPRAAAPIPATSEIKAPAAIVHRSAGLLWRPAAIAAVWPQLRRMVEREVARRAETALAAPALRAEPVRNGTHTAAEAARPPEVTDRLVAQIITRMRTLAREERFRAGRLR